MKAKRRNRFYLSPELFTWYDWVEKAGQYRIRVPKDSKDKCRCGQPLSHKDSDKCASCAADKAEHDVKSRTESAKQIVRKMLHEEEQDETHVKKSWQELEQMGGEAIANGLVYRMGDGSVWRATPRGYYVQVNKKYNTAKHGVQSE